MQERSVLMLSYPFPPASFAGVHRTLRFVKYLSDYGWEPIVLAPEPKAFDPISSDPALESAIPRGTVVERTTVYRPVRALENFVKSIRIPRAHGGNGKTSGKNGSATPNMASPQATHPSCLMRFAHDTLNLFLASPDTQIGWFFPALNSALKLIRRHPIQAIYSTGPPHSSHLIAAALRIMTRLPIVIDFRDPWSRGTWKYGRGKIQQYLQPGMERLCVQLASRVILNTPTLCEEFRNAYSNQPPAKFVAIPNGFDPDASSQWEVLSKNHEFSANKTAIVCHPGTVYGKRDLRPVVAAVEKLLHAGHRVKFEQIGNIENEAEIKSYANSLGLNGAVSLCGRLPHEDTLRRMACADIFLLSQPGTILQIPSKIFEMLPFGRPIVALTESAGATADVINEYRLGKVVHPSDSSAIAAAISQSIELAHEFKATSGWRKAMEAFNGRELTKRFAQVLDDCLKTGCS